jgi:hypothetical protein
LKLIVFGISVVGEENKISLAKQGQEKLQVSRNCSWNMIVHGIIYIETREAALGYNLFHLFIVGTFVGIRHRRELEFVGSLNRPPKVPKFWYPNAEFRRLQLSLVFGKTGRNLALVHRNPTFIAETSQNLAIAAEFQPSSLEFDENGRYPAGQ